MKKPKDEIFFYVEEEKALSKAVIMFLMIINPTGILLLASMEQVWACSTTDRKQSQKLAGRLDIPSLSDRWWDQYDCQNLKKLKAVWNSKCLKKNSDHKFCT